MEKTEIQENYYDRLEVPVNATDDEIKLQYRRLAKRCHPDLNPNNPKAAAQFRELHAAYVVLSNPEKRRVYDDSVSSRSRTRPSNYSYRPPHRTQTWSGGSARRRGPRVPLYKPDQPRSNYFNYSVTLSIEELFKGTRTCLTISQTHTCPRCRGKGVLGTGEKCPRCGGYTFLVSHEQLELIIPPGILPGTMIRAEIGHKFASSPVFDMLYINEVLVTIQVKDDEQYTTSGQHLYTTVRIPQAMLEEGGKWYLSAPEGGELQFTIPGHSPSGTVLTLRRHGLKNGASQRRGNLYLTLLAES